ncbi:MAG: hypothetical protein AAF722_13350 [Cyanobacteria bacterium P01_C01_bin.70]
MALFCVETANLDKLASVFAKRMQSAANHKRLTRCFGGFTLNYDTLARAVVISWSPRLSILEVIGLSIFKVRIPLF